MRRKSIGVGIAVCAILLFVLGRLGGVLVDWAWFSSVGYAGVFWTVFLTKAAVFLTAFVASALVLWVNAALALRYAVPPSIRLAAAADHRLSTIEALPGAPAAMLAPEFRLSTWRLIALAAVLLVSVLIALGEMGQWELILRYLHQVPYGQTDPQFGKDIGFYLFSLPVYVAVKDWLLLVLVVAVAIAGAIYFVLGAIDLDRGTRRIASTAVAHGSALLGFGLALKAWSYVLDRYLLLYNDNGVVVGAAYTDVHVELPVLWVLVAFSAIAAVLAWANVGCAPTGWSSRRWCWCSARHSCSAKCCPACSNASSSSRASCNWRRHTCSGTSR